MFAGRGADVHDPVRTAHDVELVLHHEQRVASRLELVERGEQRLGVRRMQPRRRLVEHVHHAEQVGAYLRGQAKALELAR